MEYLRGWRAMRQDPQWMGKVGVGSLLFLSAMCIPVVGQVVLLGWTSLMLRRAVSGVDAPMPRLDLDFDYLGKLLNIGFKAFLARLLWSLPAMLIGMVCGCGMYIAMGGAVMAVGVGGSAGGEVGAGLGGLGAICIMFGAFALFWGVLVAVSLPMQVAVLRAELSNDVNLAMRFKDVMSMTRLLARELIFGYFVMTALGMVGAFFGLITLYIGLFPVVVILTIIHTYYAAELYKVYLQKGGTPLPIGPLDVEETPAPPRPYHPGTPPQF